MIIDPNTNEADHSSLKIQPFGASKPLFNDQAWTYTATCYMAQQRQGLIQPAWSAFNTYIKKVQAKKKKKCAMSSFQNLVEGPRHNTERWRIFNPSDASTSLLLKSGSCSPSSRFPHHTEWVGRASCSCPRNNGPLVQQRVQPCQMLTLSFEQ